MSFKFYKFCQNPLSSISTAVFTMFYILSISGSLPWWAGLLISVAATVIALIPPLGIVHPVTYCIFHIIALIKAFNDSSLFFWFILPILIIHIIRNVAIATFAHSNPEKSLEYDMAIRGGYTP